MTAYTLGLIIILLRWKVKQYPPGTSKLGGQRPQESDVGRPEIQSIVRTNI